MRSREKQLARAEAQSVAPPTPPPPRAIGVALEASRRAGRGFAFEANGLAKAYAKPLFSGLTIDVERGDRLAVVGPNGSGKSTFLRILAGDVASDAGTVRFNPAAQMAYFTQNSYDSLDPNASAVDAVIAASGATDHRARSLLGRMRISGEAADQRVASFSGGERRRIMLACLMARAADVLLLDEPTNDLDIDSREALESVLADYEGAIVVVSHDRFLLSRLCDRVLWIEDGAWGAVNGGYETYEANVRERERRAIDARTRTSGERPKTSRMTALKRRSTLETQIKRIEREIASLDTRKAEIEDLFAQPELYADGPRVAALHAELEALGARSGATVTQWEALLEELEGLQ